MKRRLSHVRALCEVCGRAKPLYLYRLESLLHEGGHDRTCPSSALCETCAHQHGVELWIARGKEVAA